MAKFNMTGLHTHIMPKLIIQRLSKEVQPENNGLQMRKLFSFVCLIYSTFGVAASPLAWDGAATDSSAGFAGPVCVIGTTRSVFCGTALRAAVMVSTPSDDKDD